MSKHTQVKPQACGVISISVLTHFRRRVGFPFQQSWSVFVRHMCSLFPGYVCVFVSLREKHTRTDTHSTYFSPARSLEDHLFFPSMPWGSESHVSSRWTHTHTQDDYEWMSQSGSGKCVWRKRDNARKVCVCVWETVFWPITVKYCSLLHVYELVWIRYCFFWYNTVILLVALFAHSMTSSDNDIVSQTSENMKQITQGCVCVLDLNDPHNVQNNRERSCHTVSHNAMCSTASSISSVANHKKEFLKIYKYLDCWRFGHLMQIH